MNEKIFYFFYDFAHRSEFGNDLIIFLAHYLPIIVILGAFGFLLWHHEVLSSHNPTEEFKKKWREIFAVFIMSTTAWVLARVLKIIIETERPFDALQSVNALIERNDFSFPSGHATFFSALATLLFFHHKKIGILFFVFAIIISMARMMAGVHFPIDILAGFALGVFIAYFLKKI